MPDENEIQILAGQIFDNIQMRAAEAKKELAKLDIKRAELQAQISSAEASNDRYRKFRPVIDRVAQCPRCGVNKGSQIDCKAIPGGTDNEDGWRCPDCNYEFSTLA
ncbi:MAG: hypothetical protein GY789_20665 [Hyphomicrobiales bacterium]|nr:hypothetical protein [Hyphomicrobiales bacterium]